MRTGRTASAPLLVIAAMGLVVGLAVPAAAHEAGRISGKSIKANSVTGKQIKESTLATVPKARLARKLPPLTWHLLTLENGWVNFTSDERAAAYAVDAEGIVHLRGVIQHGAANSDAFALPSDVANPSLDLVVQNVAANGTRGQLNILDGFVAPQTADDSTTADVSGFTDLEGVTFAAS